MRADTPHLEAAQIIAADEEAILDPHDIAAPGMDVAAFGGEAQHILRCNREVIAGIDHRSVVLHAGGYAGKIGRELAEIARCRIEPVVALVVEQHLAYGRRDARTSLLLD